jgi:MerR family transcriptional regulator, thiopeptide resistance regulator
MEGEDPMPGPSWTVGELARRAGVTVRTLHHYDEIRLLRPRSFTESGYRLYGPDDLERLSLVRLYREAGLPLEEIRRILDAPGFDRDAALRAHRERLLATIDDTRALVAVVDRLLDPPGGTMDNPYEEEARQRWGHTDAYKESQRRAKKYDADTWKQIGEESGAVEAELAACLAAGEPAEGVRAMDAAEAHRQQIDRWFYPCGPEMHTALGEMYVADPRFTAHYDKRAPGLAAYVCAAITANALRSV